MHFHCREIPAVRFERAQRNEGGLFRPSVLPQAYSPAKDIFSLRPARMTHRYRRISLDHQVIEVPKVHPHRDDELQLVPGVP